MRSFETKFTRFGLCQLGSHPIHRVVSSGMFLRSCLNSCCWIVAFGCQSVHTFLCHYAAGFLLDDQDALPAVTSPKCEVWKPEVAIHPRLLPTIFCREYQCHGHAPGSRSYHSERDHQPAAASQISLSIYQQSYASSPIPSIISQMPIQETALVGRASIAAPD